MLGFATAFGSYQAALQHRLAAMTLEQREDFFRRQRERREREELLASPEVTAARRAIVDLGLSPEQAAELIDFALGLAKQRVDA